MSNGDQNLPDINLEQFRKDLETGMQQQGGKLRFNTANLDGTVTKQYIDAIRNNKSMSSEKQDELVTKIYETGDRYCGYLNTLISENRLDQQTGKKDLKTLALKKAETNQHQHEYNSISRAFKEIVKSILEAVGLYERHFDVMHETTKTIREETQKEGPHAAKLLEERQHQGS